MQEANNGCLEVQEETVGIWRSGGKQWVLEVQEETVGIWRCRRKL